MGVGNEKYISNMDPQGPSEDRNEKSGASLFGSLLTILTPHIRQPRSETTCTLADLGEGETIRAQKEAWVMTERRLKGPHEGFEDSDEG